MAVSQLPPLVLEFDVDDSGSLKVKKIEGTLAKLGMQLDQTGTKTDAYQGKMGRAMQTLEKMGVSTTALRSTMIPLGLAIAGVTVGVAAMTAALIPAIRRAAEFQSIIIDLGRVTSTPFGKMREDLMALDSALGRPSDLAAGYYNAISSGAKAGADALDLLTVASKASKAAHLDQATAILALTKMMAAFEGEIKTATQASDLLFVIENYGQTTFAELASVIGEVSAIAHNAGATSFELGAALAQVTLTAGNTHTAATSLKNLFQKLINPTEEMSKALKDMGYQTAIQLIQTKGLIPALEMLNKAANDAGVNYGKFYGSIEAMQGILALQAKDFAGVKMMLDGTKQSLGLTEKAWADYKTTVNAKWDTLMNSLDKVLVKLGLMTSEGTSQFLDSLIAVTQATEKWVDANDEWMGAGFTAVLSAISGIIRIMAHVISLVTGAQIEWNKAVEDSNGLLAHLPIDETIYLLQKLADTINMVSDIWEAKVTGMTTTFNLFQINMAEDLSKVITVFTNTLNGIADIYNKTIGKLSGVMIEGQIIPPSASYFEELRKGVLDDYQRSIENIGKKGLGRYADPTRTPTPINMASDEETQKKQKQEQEKAADMYKDYIQSMSDLRRRYEHESVQLGLEGVEQRLSQTKFEYDEGKLQLERALTDRLATKGLSAEQEKAMRSATNEVLISLEKKYNADVAKINADELKRRNEELKKQQEALEQLADGYRRQFDAMAEYNKTVKELHKLVGEGLINHTTYANAMTAAFKRQQEQEKQLMLQENSWLSGAKVAFKDYKDAATDAAKTTYDVMSKAFSGLEDMLTEFITKGTFDMKAFSDMMVSEITRAMVVRPMMASMMGGDMTGGLGNMAQGGGGLFNWLGGLFGGGKAPAPGSPNFIGPMPAANGGVWIPKSMMFGDGGSMPTRTHSTSGITNGPTILAGEKYRREAFLPIPSGERIPVEVRGGGERVFNINNSWNIITPDPGTFVKSKKQIDEDQTYALMRARNRS